jgi:hypothetical protein
VYARHGRQLGDVRALGISCNWKLLAPAARADGLRAGARTRRSDGANDPKWRRSMVAMSEMSSRSAVATTDASTVPSGRFRRVATSGKPSRVSFRIIK